MKLRDSQNFSLRYPAFFRDQLLKKYYISELILFRLVGKNDRIAGFFIYLMKRPALALFSRGNHCAKNKKKRALPLWKRTEVQEMLFG
jgi:hypothetical protein